MDLLYAHGNNIVCDVRNSAYSIDNYAVLGAMKTRTF